MIGLSENNGTGKKEEINGLAFIIKRMNEHFGVNIKPKDKVFFETIKNHYGKNENLIKNITGDLYE